MSQMAATGAKWFVSLLELLYSSHLNVFLLQQSRAFLRCPLVLFTLGYRWSRDPLSTPKGWCINDSYLKFLLTFWPSYPYLGIFVSNPSSCQLWSFWLYRCVVTYLSWLLLSMMFIHCFMSKEPFLGLLFLPWPLSGPSSTHQFEVPRLNGTNHLQHHHWINPFSSIWPIKSLLCF